MCLEARLSFFAKNFNWRCPRTLCWGECFVQEIVTRRSLWIVHNQRFVFFYFRQILVGCQTQWLIGHAERIYEMGISFLNILGRWGGLDGNVIMKHPQWVYYPVIPTLAGIWSSYWKLFLSFGLSSSARTVRCWFSCLLYMSWQDINTSYVICSFSSVLPQAGVMEGRGGWTVLSVIFIMRLWLTYTCDTRYCPYVCPAQWEFNITPVADLVMFRTLKFAT
jgi:hypothetical protein